MNYFNYYIVKNKINKEDEYHLKVIDYLLLLKLIMHNKGFYFYNNFYIEWISYLIPYIKPFTDNKYYEINLYKYIICKYNINHNLFDIKLENNFYISIAMKVKNNLENIKIVNFDIFIMKKYFIKKIVKYFNLIFPIVDINFIKNNDWNYYKFNNYVEELWVYTKTLEMNDYIYSEDHKRKLYYEIFKKIVLRILHSKSEPIK